MRSPAMSIHDSYVGKKATNYEAKRANKPKWRKEAVAVSQLLPPNIKTVLDIPVGTGRFFKIYKERGLIITGFDTSNDMLAEARKKEIKATLLNCDIRHIDITPLGIVGKYDVSVCIRLSNWLEPYDMSKSIKELARVSHTVIFGIRTNCGSKPEGNSGHLWVHSHLLFQKALDESSLRIYDERVIDTGGYKVYKLCS